MTLLTKTRTSSLIIDLRGEPTIQLGSTIFKLDENPPSKTSQVSVRIFDIVAASCLLLAATPIMIAVAVAIRFSSTGPAIYRSERTGLNRKKFHAYKFRSMYHGADEILNDLLRTDPAMRAEYETSYKLKQDPRVTAVGRWIRKLNLDELPQLVNVLRGDMSLVGPRPITEAEQDEYQAVLDTLLRVKPGLTGLWQVSGRNNLSLDQRTMLEVEYATTRTLPGDIKICLKTAAQMVRPANNGAY